jgi:predicted lactoylglutathione lyase
MANDLWLNLPVRDLAASITFYEAMGFTRNFGPGNTDSSACFIVGGKKTVLMLFLDPLFSGFAGAPVSDTALGAEVLLSVGAGSRDEVDALAQRAREAGGEVYAEPGGAPAGMYGCGLRDPDGHRWNILHMG